MHDERCGCKESNGAHNFSGQELKMEILDHVFVAASGINLLLGELILDCIFSSS